MDIDARVELALIIERWLVANPMHTTLFGRQISLFDNGTSVPDFAAWMAESVVQAVEWSDHNF